MRKVIVNTTPLIALADVGKLNLLKQLCKEIIIPQAVFDEVKSEPARTLASNSKWIKVNSIFQDEEKGLFSAKLHAGEVEVMMLAKEQHADLIIMDDNAAKKTAKFMGLKVTGSLGVLLRAKREGLLDAVKPVMLAMISDGFFIDEKTRQLVLEAAGEE